MMNNIILFYGGLFVVLVAITMILYYFQRTGFQEGFEDKEVESEQEALTLIRKINSSLEAPYKKVFSSFSTDNRGSELEAMTKDCQLLFKDVPDAQGIKIVPIPLSEDVLEIPADIDIRLSTTILYISTKTSQLLADIERSLSCKEGFETTTTTTTLTPEEKKKYCCSEESIKPSLTPEEKAQITYSRTNQLQKVLGQPAIETALSTISSNFNKLQDIENKTKDGTLMPNCGASS